MSAPHASLRPADVALDGAALRRLSAILSDLETGAPASPSPEPSSRSDHRPGKLVRAEMLQASGAAARARAAHRLVMALDAEHRPVARWVATSAPPSASVDTWPTALARAIGPRELAETVDRTAAAVRHARQVFALARGNTSRVLTVATAVAVDTARTALAGAVEAHGAAVCELDAWGRVRLAAMLAATDAAREHRRSAASPSW